MNALLPKPALKTRRSSDRLLTFDTPIGQVNVVRKILLSLL